MKAVQKRKGRLLEATINPYYPRLESNQRPFAPEANALSTELRGRNQSMGEDNTIGVELSNNADESAAHVIDCF